MTTKQIGIINPVIERAHHNQQKQGSTTSNLHYARMADMSIQVLLKFVIGFSVFFSSTNTDGNHKIQVAKQ